MCSSCPSPIDTQIFELNEQVSYYPCPWEVRNMSIGRMLLDRIGASWSAGSCNVEMRTNSNSVRSMQRKHYGLECVSTFAHELCV